MKKLKRISARLKRLFKEFEAYDIMHDGKLSSALIAGISFLLILLAAIYFVLFG